MSYTWCRSLQKEVSTAVLLLHHDTVSLHDLQQASCKLCTCLALDSPEAAQLDEVSKKLSVIFAGDLFAMLSNGERSDLGWHQR